METKHHNYYCLKHMSSNCLCDISYCDIVKGVIEVSQTPVDMPIKEGDIPNVLKQRVAQDILDYEQSLVLKTTYERISHGNNETFIRFIYVPALQLTIGHINKYKSKKL